jgi:signal peptidase I
MSNTEYDRYAPGQEVTPPEAFDPPQRPPIPPEVSGIPEPLSAAEPIPSLAVQPIPALPIEPYPGHGVESHSGLVPEPLPALAGEMTATPDAVLPIERSPFSVDRLVEELVAWLKTLASAAVYATLIVTFGFQVARVEGQSMAPTLSDQDRLIVNKLAYRLGEPQVGDIVMLYYPLRPEKSFVKRVIASEGDQVKVVDGKVYRNDVLMDDSFVPPDYRSHDDWGPQVIPEGYYFVLGDHRNNSSDSRHWGFVPKKYIIGRVQLRWWPVPTARLFY